MSSNLLTRILYPRYCMTLNLIISGVHQSHLGCWGHRSEKVKLSGLHTRCASALSYSKTVLNVFGSY